MASWLCRGPDAGVRYRTCVSTIARKFFRPDLGEICEYHSANRKCRIFQKIINLYDSNRKIAPDILFDESTSCRLQGSELATAKPESPYCGVVVDDDAAAAGLESTMAMVAIVAMLGMPSAMD